MIDSHCHLNMKEFNDDLDLVINKAYQKNISGMLTISTKVEEVNSVIEISDKYNCITKSDLNNHIQTHRRDNLLKCPENNCEFKCI